MPQFLTNKMSKYYTIAIKKAEEFAYQHPNIQGVLDGFTDGRYLVSFQRLDPKSEEKDYRACYFAKVQMLGDEVGHTKYEMHELIKEHVLKPMVDGMSELFANEGIVSTTALDLEGWLVFLERLDFWAWDNYHVILQ